MEQEQQVETEASVETEQEIGFEAPDFESLSEPDPEPSHEDRINSVIDKRFRPQQANEKPDVTVAAKRALFEEFKQELAQENQRAYETQQQEANRIKGIESAKQNYLNQIRAQLDKAGVDVESSEFLNEYALSTLDSMILKVQNSEGYIDKNDVKHIANVHWGVFEKKLKGYMDKPLIKKKVANPGGAGSGTVVTTGAVPDKNLPLVERMKQEFKQKLEAGSLSRAERFAYMNRINQMGGGR